MDEWLQEAMRVALRDGADLSVGMLDLDRFKAFNDRCGHDAGDALLREAARCWERELRAGDRIARIGGEEFGVLLRDCSEASVIVALDRVREATPGAHTCSAGVATWDGTESAAALLRRADEAMYAAKRAGRDSTRAAGAAVGLPVY